MYVTRETSHTGTVVQKMPEETAATAEPEVTLSESEQHKKDGNMYFASADYVKAVAAYNKAIKADPKNGVLYRFVSSLLCPKFAFLILSFLWTSHMRAAGSHEGKFQQHSRDGRACNVGQLQKDNMLQCKWICLSFREPCTSGPIKQCANFILPFVLAYRHLFWRTERTKHLWGILRDLSRTGKAARMSSSEKRPCAMD